MNVKLINSDKRIRCSEKDLPFGMYYGRARGHLGSGMEHVLIKTEGNLFFLIDGVLCGGGIGSEHVNVVRVAVEDITVKEII